MTAHADVATTMIYVHVLELGGGAVRSPLDALPAQRARRKADWCQWRLLGFKSQLLRGTSVIECQPCLAVALEPQHSKFMTLREPQFLHQRWPLTLQPAI